MISNWLTEAQRVAELLQQYAVRDDGLVVQSYNVSTGKPVTSRILTDELGDFCQYVYLLSDAIEDPSLSNWALQQAISACKGSTIKGAIYPSEDDSIFYPLIRMGDCFWGLSELYRLTKNEVIREIFDNYIEFVIRHCSNQNRPTYGAFRLPGMWCPLPLSEPMTAGYVSESLLEMHHSTGNRYYLDVAQTMIDSWLDTSSWQQHHLFTRGGSLLDIPLAKQFLNGRFSHKQRPLLEENILTKGDVFLLFAVLNLYRTTGQVRYKNALLNWVEMIEKYMISEDGFFYNSRNPHSNHCYSIKLEENHSVIELLLDIAFDLDEKRALNLAERAINAWHGTIENGLYKNIKGDDWAELDPMSDFCVNALKLGELSQNNHYTILGMAGINRVKSAFNAPFGMYQKINLDGSLRGNIVETKFIGLYIKTCLIADIVDQNGRLFASSQTRLLATDR